MDIWYIYIYIWIYIWICIYNQNQLIISYNIQWSYQLIMTAARQDHLDDNCPPWDHELNLYLCIEGGIGWYVCWCFEIPFLNGWFKGQIQLLETPVLVGGLEHFLCFPYTVLGMSSSQLIKSYFSKGVGIPPTSYIYCEHRWVSWSDFPFQSSDLNGKHGNGSRKRFIDRGFPRHVWFPWEGMFFSLPGMIFPMTRRCLDSGVNSRVLLGSVPPFLWQTKPTLGSTEDLNHMKSRSWIRLDD